MSNNNSRDLPGLPLGLHNEDEAVAIENAIRAAINTVMTVICSACNRRVLEYERMVADRDAEIRRLECKLEKSESEMRMLRAEVGRRQSSDQMKNEHEVRSCGVGAATPTHPSPKSHDTVEAFPHQHAQTPSWEGERAPGCQPFRCITSLVKEEPSDLETVIKWEVCEGSLLDQQEGQRGAEDRHKEKPAKKGKPRHIRNSTWPSLSSPTHSAGPQNRDARHKERSNQMQTERMHRQDLCVL